MNKEHYHLQLELGHLFVIFILQANVHITQNTLEFIYYPIPLSVGLMIVFYPSIG